jgi:S1-C subfamily serine protease
MFNTTVLPGMSGGGVFNMEGELIGIINAMSPEGYAIIASTTGLPKE